MQSAILILAEEKLKDVGCDYRNALKSSREHRTMRHEEERKKQQKSLEEKSRDEIRRHRMLGTKNAWMTESEVDAALANLRSNTQKLDAVKDQWRMWTWGAGWTDVHQAFSKQGKAFKWDYLADQLKKEVIRKHVATGRSIRACPSTPFETQKPLPEIGDTLCDVLAMKEEDALKEEATIIAMYDKYGLTRQPVAMPDLKSLIGKKIQIYFWYKDENDTNDRGQGRWYAGEVLRVNRNRATIEWAGDYENPDDKVTIEILTSENWVQPGSMLEESCWRLG